MITNEDMLKMKKIFSTKEDLKLFATKKEMETGFSEIIKFIGEIKSDILKEFHDFRKEMNDFKYEMRDITRNQQTILDNHETRFASLEFNK